MKLKTLKSTLPTLKVGLPTLTTNPASTPRLRGRAGVERRRRWLEQHPLCAKCEEAGITRAATVPDHIVPLWKGGADDDSNLMSLCAPHHAEKTAAEAAERGGNHGRY